MNIKNFIQGKIESIFNKNTELDKKRYNMLKDIKSGNKLWKEFTDNCIDIEEFKQKIHFFKSQGVLNEKIIDVVAIDKKLETIKTLAELKKTLDKKQFEELSKTFQLEYKK